MMSAIEGEDLATVRHIISTYPKLLRNKLYKAMIQSTPECFEDVATMILNDCDSAEVKRIASGVDKFIR